MSAFKHRLALQTKEEQLSLTQTARSFNLMTVPYCYSFGNVAAMKMHEVKIDSKRIT